MAFMKELVAIALVAGILTAGVRTLVPVPDTGTTEPAPAAIVPPIVGTPPRDLAEAAGRPGDAVALAHASPPPVLGPAQVTLVPETLSTAVAEPVPSLSDGGGAEAAPEPTPTPPVRAPEAADTGLMASIETKPAEPDRDAVPRTAWVPTPRPELVAKADAAFDNGDVAGARLWLREALAQGDADAAFRLAQTYDPRMLTEWKVVGLASDVDKAKAYYEIAALGGVEAARERLALQSR